MPPIAALLIPNRLSHAQTGLPPAMQSVSAFVHLCVSSNIYDVYPEHIPLTVLYTYIYVLKAHNYIVLLEECINNGEIHL